MSSMKVTLISERSKQIASRTLALLLSALSMMVRVAEISRGVFFPLFFLDEFLLFRQSHFHRSSGRALWALSLSVLQKNARSLPSRQRTIYRHVESPRQTQMRLLRPGRRRGEKQRQEECLCPIALPLLRLVGGSSELGSPLPAPRRAAEVPCRCRSDAGARGGQGEGEIWSF